MEPSDTARLNIYIGIAECVVSIIQTIDKNRCSAGDKELPERIIRVKQLEVHLVRSVADLNGTCPTQLVIDLGESTAIRKPGYRKDDRRFVVQRNGRSGTADTRSVLNCQGRVRARESNRTRNVVVGTGNGRGAARERERTACMRDWPLLPRTTSAKPTSMPSLLIG